MFTTALVTVTATSNDKNAPTRLRTADRATAGLGLSAPVAMDVAIELPVSWNPLVKSKPSATITTRIKVSSCADTGRVWGQGDRQGNPWHPVHQLFKVPFTCCSPAHRGRSRARRGGQPYQEPRP